VSDAKLIATAQAFLGDDETVQVAGMFQPRGTTGGMMGATSAGFATDNLAGEIAGAATGLMAGQAMSRVDEVPRWTLLALTDTKLYALACGEHGAHWVPESRFAVLDRGRIHATVRSRVNVRTLSIEDPDSGRTYEWEGNRIGPAHAKDLIEALEAETIEAPEEGGA
jgi:hypothetical protein